MKQTKPFSHLFQVGNVPANKQHGWGNTPLYKVWDKMNYRCTDPRSKSWHNYGGRGITICPEWRESFVVFKDWALANGYAPGLEIDRADNNAGYSPTNCRFVTRKENASNRRDTLVLCAFGESKKVVDWLNDPRCTVPASVLRGRIKMGWPGEKALSQPIRHKNRNN